MKRWHDERHITRGQWLNHRRTHVEHNIDSSRKIGVDPYEVDCACDEQMGRFRKRDAYDCGNTRCQLCHGDKFPRREPTRQEQLAALRFREEVAEVSARATERR